MTATTPYRSYVYPIASDRPRDTPLLMSRMVDTLEADLVYLDSEFRRFERFPLAIVEATVPQAATFVSNLVFDTVLEDTWGMVDLSVSPSSIAIPPDVPGVYMVGGYIVGGAIGSNIDYAGLRLYQSGAWGWTGDMTITKGSSNATGIGLGAWSLQRLNPAVDLNLTLSAASTGPGSADPTITYARFWAYYVSDM